MTTPPDQRDLLDPPPIRTPLEPSRPAPTHRDLKPANRGRWPSWAPSRRVVGAGLAGLVLAAGIVAGAGLGPAWLPVAARVVAAVVPLVQQAVVEDTAALPVPGPDAAEEPVPGEAVEP